MAEQEVGLSVVYGDTDSIFVLTKEREIKRAVAIGRELAVKVNKKFSCLTIEIDAIFKRLLLLKKKKYVALKPDGEMEVKVRLSSLDENPTSILEALTSIDFSR